MSTLDFVTFEIQKHIFGKLFSVLRPVNLVK